MEVGLVKLLIVSDSAAPSIVTYLMHFVSTMLLHQKTIFERRALPPDTAATAGPIGLVIRLACRDENSVVLILLLLKIFPAVHRSLLLVLVLILAILMHGRCCL